MRATILVAGLCLAVGLFGAVVVVRATPGHAATRAVAKATVLVTAGKPSEFAFKLSKKEVPAGVVAFKVTNGGKAPHTFEICSATAKNAKANACKGKVTKSLAPGKSQTLTVTLKKGAHEFLCTVPGHAKLGMKGLLGVGVKPPATGLLAETAPATTTPVTTTATTTTQAKTCANPQSTTVNVNEFDFGFTLSQNPVPCGSITFNQVNTGQTTHNFDVNGNAGSLIEVGQTTAMTLSLTPGTYRYVCDVNGHPELGMVGMLTVTG